jgi:hypothetical protein
MGKDKEWLDEIDNITNHLIDAGVVVECSMHPGCTFLSGEERTAYAVATNAVKDGIFPWPRELVISTIKQILLDLPDRCTGCSDI